MRTVTCSTRLSEPENEKLLKIKEETGTCISSLIREAVCYYLAEQKVGLITNHSSKEDLPIAGENEELAIIAKQQDDWWFQEYEEVSSP